MAFRAIFSGMGPNLVAHTALSGEGSSASNLEHVFFSPFISNGQDSLKVQARGDGGAPQFGYV